MKVLINHVREIRVWIQGLLLKYSVNFHCYISQNV